MMKPVFDAFTECQRSVVNEINYAINELISGRYEEVYNVLKNLSDELTTDVQISTGKFEVLLGKACEEYEKRKELNTTTTNENV